LAFGPWQPESLRPTGGQLRLDKLAQGDAAMEHLEEEAAAMEQLAHLQPECKKPECLS